MQMKSDNCALIILVGICKYNDEAYDKKRSTAKSSFILLRQMRAYFIVNRVYIYNFTSGWRYAAILGFLVLEQAHYITVAKFCFHFSCALVALSVSRVLTRKVVPCQGDVSH